MNLKIHFNTVNLVLAKCIENGKAVTIQGGKSANPGDLE